MEFTVIYTLNEREIKALEELLPYWKAYENKGEKPFAKWTIQNLFQTIMSYGSRYTISDKINNEQFRQNLIEISDISKPFKTIQERIDEKKGESL